MMPQSNLPNGCSFCTRMTLQKKQLFFNLFKTFSKELQKARKQYGNELAQSETGSFKQLLRIIFAEQPTEHQSLCQHKKYLTHFTQKLACSENDLNLISQKIAQRLAEKHYHLQLLSNQVKNSAESIAQGKVRMSDQEPSSYEISSRVHRQRNKEKSQLIKRQDKGEMEANECTINTGSTIAGNSLSFIPIFNSQLNITEPVQPSITFATPNQLGYYYPYPVFYSHQTQ